MSASAAEAASDPTNTEPPETNTEPPETVTEPSDTRPPAVVPWMRWAGPLVLVAAVAVHLLVYRHWPTFALQIDVLVYRFGGVRVLDGLDLYVIGRNGGTVDLLFTYTPFAAIAFTPLAVITDYAAQVVGLVVTPLCGMYAVWRMLRHLGLTAATGLLGLLALLIGLLAWLEPIRLSVQLGQINLFILAVVTIDLLAPKDRKWAGIGIGLVAGMKLTPAIFIVYLFLVGRIRAGLIASGTLLATVVVGFIVLPSDSTYYWFGRAFENVNRIARDPALSTSLRGLFLRLDWPTGLATLLALAVGAAALAVAVVAYRRNEALLGIALVGLASAAVSPFSWSHHWVWFTPLAVLLGYRAYVLGSRASAWTLWVSWALLAAWFTTLQGPTPRGGIVTWQPGGILDDLLPATYLAAFLAVLVATAVRLRRSPPDNSPVAAQPIGTAEPRA